MKFRHLFLGLATLAVIGCSDKPTQVLPDANTTVPKKISFDLVNFPTDPVPDTILAIRVNWTEASDSYGSADFYRHTMIASKNVTDVETGPLPIFKEIHGLVDTAFVKLSLINDSVTLESRVWSVRRGLTSTSPGVGTLFVRRGDMPPPPPTGVTVVTLIIPVNPDLLTDGVLVSIPEAKLPSTQGLGGIINRSGNVSVVRTGAATTLTIYRH